MQFKEAPKEKERKHLRDSGEIAKKMKDWKKMVGPSEHGWKLREKLKLGVYLLIMFKTLSEFKVYEFFSLPSGQFWLYQTNETNLSQHFSSNFLIQFVYQEGF